MEIVGTNMRPKISDTINSFFNNNRTTISSLIRSMKLDKADFGSLIKRINNSSSFNEFKSSQVNSMSEISKEPIIELFRDSSLRINRLFNAANTGGIVLDSMINIISTDIEKAEEDLKNLELFINNYEFLSGKDDLYTGNYIEKFDNSLNDYTSDGYNFEIPDRDNTKFPLSGNYFIDSAAGLLKLGSNQSFNNIINNIKSIKIVNNYSNYISSESDFKNVFTDSLADSWSVTTKSPALLSSDLNEYKQYISYDAAVPKGAKTVVELELHSAIEIDTIRVNPNFGNGFQLLQIVLFNSLELNDLTNITTSTESSKTLLSSPKLLNSSTEILFDKFTANKIIFIFNQSSYTRSRKVPITSELNSKAMENFVQTRLNENREKFSKFQDIAYWFFNRRFTIDGVKKNKSSDIEYYSYRFPESLHTYAKYVEQELVKASNYSITDNPVFVNSPIFIELVNSMLNIVSSDKKYLNLGGFINSRTYAAPQPVLSNPGFISSMSITDINDPKYQYYNESYTPSLYEGMIKSLLIEENTDIYEYSFSLKSIDLITTNGAQANKACFVSKKIPVDGQVLGVKAKIQTIENSISSLENQFQLRNHASYELSISNVDYPINEEDWTPIAFNQDKSIPSEVIFFDITNLSAKLRFKPKLDSIVLFKDGILVPANSYEYRVESDRLILKDVLQYSPTSIFCASYTIDDLAYDPYQIDFTRSNIYRESIKQYKTTSGLGQVFSRTSMDYSVQLEYVPYVNLTAAQNAKYDQFFGTIFNSSFLGYSPTKVQLSDGSYAINITNYTRSSKQVEFFGTDTVQFIQTGKNILFNKMIDKPFTVMYEYVPYGLRFRFIIRKNIPGITVPARADSVMLKLKTAQYDPYYDKLVYISKV